MKDQEDGLGCLCASLLLHIRLVFFQQFGVELDIARLVAVALRQEDNLWWGSVLTHTP